MKKGFSLLEILIALAVTALVAVVISITLSRFGASQQLSQAREEVLSLLSEARSLTLASRAEMQHGVHFESDRAVFFAGTTYNASDPQNKTYTIPPSVSLSWSITGGDDVIFLRLTGETIHTGTITFTSLKSGDISTLTIYGTGTIEE